MRSPVPLAELPTPTQRRLRVYAVDPSLAMRSSTRMIAEAVIEVPWADLQGPGPMGDYLEIVDYDESAKRFYVPIDLSDPKLLATAGLAPTGGDPRFDQQMVYAVAMKTIGHFEDALGRRVLWAPDENSRDEFVERLRVYPHAFKEDNAFYDPNRKALLFGYFPADPAQATTTFSGGLVFTCLSADIVAHETTHAILDGMMRRYLEDTNPDVYAFHEGFADLIALFQHFTYGDLLRHQIQNTRGDLASENLLAQLAGQFAEASGRHGALRDALGKRDGEVWVRATPGARPLNETLEAHARGAILVSAVFEAFGTIYASRTADLMRIASGGTGRLRPGALHPDLVARLADEAAKTARHMLSMLIRALDYCPPIDITFGEYLRALITADHDLVPNDRHGYRVAYVEAFRRWGIYPGEVDTLGEDSLRWSPLTEFLSEDDAVIVDQLKSGMREAYWPELPGYDGILKRIQDEILKREKAAKTSGKSQKETPPLTERQLVADWARNLRIKLKQRFDFVHEVPREVQRKEVTQFISGSKANPETIRFWTKEAPFWAKPDNQRALLEVLGIVGDLNGIELKIEVHEARLSTRVSPDGSARARRDLIVQITQRCFVDRDSLAVKKADPKATGDMKFRGGCTLVIDTITGEIRYAIRKRITSESRRRRQRDYQAGAFRTELLYPLIDRGDFAALHAAEAP